MVERALGLRDGKEETPDAAMVKMGSGKD